MTIDQNMLQFQHDVMQQLANMQKMLLNFTTTQEVDQKITHFSVDFKKELMKLQEENSKQMDKLTKSLTDYGIKVSNLYETKLDRYKR